MSALEMIQGWKSQLVPSLGGIENPAGFIEITNYDELIAGGSETTVVGGGGGTDTCGVCCRGGNTCCCTSCTC